LIHISDTGVVMSPDVLARIFDPFFTMKQAEGTGLGLSITQKLITRSGGKIWVDSEPSKGSRFMVFVTIAENAAGEHQ